MITEELIVRDIGISYNWKANYWDNLWLSKTFYDFICFKMILTCRLNHVYHGNGNGFKDIFMFPGETTLNEISFFFRLSDIDDLREET